MSGFFAPHPRHLPNLISAIRILLVWPIVTALLARDSRTALLLIVIAGASDGLDGYLAKRFHWQSRVGGILDPLADKLLLVAAFLTLAYQGLAPVWLAAVVVLRDVVIISGGVAFEFLIRPVEPEPSPVSKVNTGAQLLFLVAVLGADAFGWPPPGWIVALGAAVLVTCAVSGLDYVMRWARLAMALRRGSP
jgi:cardiolipin synthase (CMP-forming)